METAAWVTITVALIGVAAGIWTQVVQFKKDSQRIDGVNRTATSVKKDTAAMRPEAKKK